MKKYNKCKNDFTESNKGHVLHETEIVITAVKNNNYRENYKNCS